MTDPITFMLVSAAVSGWCCTILLFGMRSEAERGRMSEKEAADKWWTALCEARNDLRDEQETSRRLRLTVELLTKGTID